MAYQGGDAPGAQPPPTAPSGPSTKTGATPSGPTGPPPTTAAPDWTADPIYQLVLGQENLAIAQAKAEALKEETQALIAYGDYNLALAVTGDKNVALAAQANKASTLNRLIAQNKSNVRGVNDTENKNNLFYSSDRGYQLGLAQQAYLNNSADALGGVNGQINTITQNLLATEQNAYLAEQQAAQAAYGRAVQNPPGVGASSPQYEGNVGANYRGQQPPTYQGGNLASKVGTAPHVAPYPVQIKANATGGSANVKQGTFAIH